MSLFHAIDNRDYRLAEVLDDLLRGDTVQALGVVTAYYNVGAFGAETPVLIEALIRYLHRDTVRRALLTARLSSRGGLPCLR